MRPHQPNWLKPKQYHAHETARMRALEGLPLASFRARGVALTIDVFGIFLVVCIILIIRHGAGKFNLSFNLSPESAGKNFRLNGRDLGWVNYAVEFGIPIIYWGLMTYLTNGRSIGKWIAGIRVVSTSHPRITLWQSIERALGYSVSALEGGFGFIQYFITPNRRTAHDRLAETIVIRDPDRQLLQRTRRLLRAARQI
jgi:uncharacterized RDD family membrane protein YckC